MLALLVDWAACWLVVLPVVDPRTGGPEGFVVLVVYVVESAVLTWLVAGSFGKIVTGLRTAPADGRLRAISPLRLLLRQVLVALVVPPLVFRPDGRGLHDVAAGTATVTSETFRGLVAAQRPAG